MKTAKFALTAAFALLAVLLVSCGDKVKVKGCFAGAPGQSVYLGLFSPSLRAAVVDSTLSDSRGRFTFRVELPGGQPAIYTVACKEQSIPLLLAPGERVGVSSIYGIGMNYTVKGSAGSSKLRELGLVFFNGLSSLDSLRNLYASEEYDAQRKTLAQEYTRTYYRIKREQLSFIVDNLDSPAAIYALYQRLPNDNSLCGANDIIYYRMVADSGDKYFPASPYLAELKRELGEAEASGQGVQGQVATAQGAFGQAGATQGTAGAAGQTAPAPTVAASGSAVADALAGKVRTVGHPEITMPDMYGKVHALSELDGKVVLLLFWSAITVDSPMLNAELKELYAKYSVRGFEIYDVCVDTQKSLWVDAVQRQKLPWINVCDTKGLQSQPVMVYNVDRVPTGYLIDRKGDIVGRNIFGTALEKKVAELVNK